MSKNILLQTVSFLFTLLFINTPVIAEVYKWTDKNGNVHFGDRPVDQESTTIVNVKPTNSTQAIIPKENKWQKDYQTAKKEKALKKDEKAKSDKLVKSVCDKAKSRLAIYNQFGRISIMSPDGTRIYQTDKEIEKNKRDINKEIKKTCY